MPDRPRVRVIAKDDNGGSIAFFEGKLGVIPESFGVDQAGLVALLDGLTRFHEANPTVTTIEIGIGE
jgi:hypothetical protein